MIGREDAIRLAREYVLRQSISDVLEPDDAQFIPAWEYEGIRHNDAWCVSFPYRPLEEIESRTPDSLTIEIDAESGQATLIEGM